MISEHTETQRATLQSIALPTELHSVRIPHTAVAHKQTIAVMHTVSRTPALYDVVLHAVVVVLRDFAVSTDFHQALLALCGASCVMDVCDMQYESVDR